MSDLAVPYAHLLSMRDNLPKTVGTDEKYVREFNDFVRQVAEATGRDLNSFLVPQAQIVRETSGGNYLTGEIHYSGRNVCETAYLKMKIDALLNLFKIKTQKQEIGFAG